MEGEAKPGLWRLSSDLAYFPAVDNTRAEIFWGAPPCSMRNFSNQGLNLCFLQWKHEGLTAGLSRKLKSRYFFPRILSKPRETSPVDVERQRLAGCLRAGWREPSPAPGYQGSGLGTTTERVTDNSPLSNPGALTLHLSKSVFSSFPSNPKTNSSPLWETRQKCPKPGEHVPLSVEGCEEPCQGGGRSGAPFRASLSYTGGWDWVSISAG